MKSILFGSIGVLAESSEIQRRAFNEAFKEFGLDWYWNVANYIKLLQKPGGLNRIAEYSNYNLSQNDIKKIHDLKVKHFNSLFHCCSDRDVVILDYVCGIHLKRNCLKK